jgi:hydrogenase maturation protease
MSILVLGLGNSLSSDDGVGLHLLALLAEQPLGPKVLLRDGGTIGLALLGDIQDADALIALDACRMGQPPGRLGVFEGPAMDKRLRGTKRSAHEVALADLMDAARLVDALPDRRALIGIEPGSTGWGLEPGPAVAAALPKAVAQVLRLIEAWSPAHA